MNLRERLVWFRFLSFLAIPTWEPSAQLSFSKSDKVGSLFNAEFWNGSECVPAGTSEVSPRWMGAAMPLSVSPARIWTVARTKLSPK